MKKRLAPLLFLLLSACVLVMTALAAGGDAADPLISLSYLNGTYQSKIDTAVGTKLDASDKALAQNAAKQIQAMASGLSGSTAASLQEQRLKSGDALYGSTGLTCMVMAGGVKVTFSAGAVVDVTTGKEVPSGTALAARHRYLVAEDTTAAFTVSSLTAVVNFEGPYSINYSMATDYNAMADALKAMHLFKGSFTAYGSGYDLEVSATRLQALIMFIRVLGEEDAALAWSGTTPFTDIARGSEAERYVGYALEKGYTNGFTATTFLPSRPASANQYVEFMLRALGYSSTATTNLTDTMERAVTAGVLTTGESAMLKASTFLRAQLVYVSYYALDAQISGSGQTLAQRLMDASIFTAAEQASAKSLVTGARL